LKIVLDTNVLISGAFFSGPPSDIWDACMKGKFQPVISVEILNEYLRVGRQFSHNRPSVNWEQFLTLFLSRSLIVQAHPLQKPLCRDPHDDKFLACAFAGHVKIIVSGDNDLLALADKLEISIVTPRSFCDLYMDI
jgi:uncharacterized protein